MGHPAELTTLASYGTEIERCIDTMVLEVGRLLAEARQLHPVQWAEWVETDLPFSVAKARQLIAIHQAFATLPDRVLLRLPRPYQALFALRTLKPAELEAAIAAGQLGPDTTVEESRDLARAHRDPVPWTRNGGRRAVDIRAAKLMERDPGELTPVMKAALRRWLSSESH